MTSIRAVQLFTDKIVQKLWVQKTVKWVIIFILIIAYVHIAYSVSNHLRYFVPVYFTMFVGRFLSIISLPEEAEKKKLLLTRLRNDRTSGG